MDEVKYGEILGPEEEREDKVRSGFWRSLRRAARVIPFADELVAGYYCALDPATPARVKGILFAALAYFVVPIDIVPDFLAGIGFGDDIAVLFGALSTVRSHIRPEHREAARRALAEGGGTRRSKRR
jgi:uncharacterized membrane protein YkvA (DUF1232 family)